MMHIYTVSLFGHREVGNAAAAEEELEATVRDLLASRDYVDFLVGRSGEFDRLAAAVIRRVRRRMGTANGSLILVLPYDNAEYRQNEAAFWQYYDEVEMLTDPSVHYKAAIRQRNRAMVDRSDLTVCYLERETGGAYQTYRYAVRQGKTVLRLPTGR